ncbi:hypothetical protein [Bacteriovorax sp. Seq25_V]|uniref:hypothetical protein n=1 Tax=Bacteriovorax sp. Seq25_V TaxID=1201288 RepID=UPI00038A3A7C|nr:hypothetical protein [Bacteriovorax sp. Seq25_V]EQC44046.1 hypothetical protein M900_1472 [Bacteriovorax sp. Seq25_V]
MKKNLLIIAIITIIAVGGILLFVKKGENVEDISKHFKLDTNSVITGQDKTFETTDEQRVIEASKLNSDVEVEEQMEKWDEQYDQLEKEWKNLVLNLFTVELNLEQAAYEDYLLMKEGLSKDKLRAFEAFHAEMEKKYGDNYTYNPSDEEIQFEKDIQQKYDELLKSKLGEGNFIKYLELRDNFNQSLMEKQDPNEGVILMDF